MFGSKKQKRKDSASFAKNSKWDAQNNEIVIWNNNVFIEIGILPITMFQSEFSVRLHTETK